MKIAFVCSEYPPRPHGGIGTFVHSFAWALQQRGHQITVVGLSEANHEYYDGPIRVVTLRENRTRFVGHLISRLRLRSWLAAEAKAGKIEIVEVPDYQGLLPFGVGRYSVVVRLHLTSTAMWLKMHGRVPKVIFFYERWTLRSNPWWIGVSQSILDSTKEIFGNSPKREVRIYNPVPLAPSEDPDIAGLPGKFILFAGLVSRRKGALVLAEAAKELLATHLDIHLVYVGGDDMESGGRSVREQVIDIVGPELAHRVHFRGRLARQNVLACMKRASVFVNPSTLEASSLVILEAMNCGAPVVCANMPPLTELVEDNVTGLLANASSPGDLAQKIARVLDDPALAKRLSLNGQQHVAKHFSMRKCAEETEAFYRERAQVTSTVVGG